MWECDNRRCRSITDTCTYIYLNELKVCAWCILIHVTSTYWITGIKVFRVGLSVVIVPNLDHCSSYSISSWWSIRALHPHTIHWAHQSNTNKIFDKISEFVYVGSLILTSTEAVRSIVFTSFYFEYFENTVVCLQIINYHVLSISLVNLYPVFC